MIHELKTWIEHYQAVTHPDPKQRKTVEIRKDDRGYQVGDVLILSEYNKDTEAYTGNAYGVTVTHILRGDPWVPEGYVAMSILPLGD